MSSTEYNPLVSIVTPSFNSAKYLEQAIKSVLEQDYPNIEHLIADGGSTDGSLDILSKYEEGYPDRVRFLSEADHGPDEGWNKGLIMARGDIIGWLGADDTFKPGAVSAVVEFFENQPESFFVYGGCDLVDGEGQVIGEAPVEDFDLSRAVNDRFAIPTPSAFYKREVVEKVGLLDTSLAPADIDYWLRIGKEFKLCRIEKVLANFRIHPESITGSKESARAYARANFVISRRHGGKLWSPMARRYYLFVFVDSLRPVFGPIYPLLKHLPFFRSLNRQTGGANDA